MPAVIFAEGSRAPVNRATIARLKEMALAAPDRRSRFCLHQNHDDPVQEMIIVLAQGTRVPPHRQIGKRKSYYLFEGRLRLRFYDEGGRWGDEVYLSASHEGEEGAALSFALRFDASVWHTVFPETPFVVYLETIQGPFNPQGTDWSPAEWNWGA